MSAAWESVIGLEIHIRLATGSKLFSTAPSTYGAKANTQVAALDAALPGTLPTVNRSAVTMAVKLGLALNARIAAHSRFARKHYFYPDLPKGYQISQYDEPVVADGSLEIDLPGGGIKTIGIIRAHLEEDAGKSLHERKPGLTAIDLNRAGTPLVEIVTAPDLRSPSEAGAAMRKLHTLVRWLAICDGNLQEGAFRCDANVSVRPAGSERLGTRTEIKNLNSFRYVERAVAYETRRQRDLLAGGDSVHPETRLYDPRRDETRVLRRKETAEDYRYFPEPDLPPLEIHAADKRRAVAELPELPDARKRRLRGELGITAGDAAFLTSDRELADYFERTVAAAGKDHAQACANWIGADLMGALNKADLRLADSPVGPEALAGIVRRVADGTVSSKQAKQVFAGVWAGEGSADEVIAERDLQQLTAPEVIAGVVDRVLAEHPEQARQYREGRAQVLKYLVGQVMKATGGRANPQAVTRALEERLGAGGDGA